MAGLERQLSAVREALSGVGERLPVSLEHALERWLEQGETILGEWADNAREGAAAAEQTLRSGARRIGKRLGAMSAESGASTAGVVHGAATEVSSVKGIGAAYAATLAEAGISTTLDLVERCSSSEGTSELAGETGISEALLRRWSASADLTRIKGIGPDHLIQLNEAGIATVEDLAEANAPALRVRLVEQRSLDASGPGVPSASTLEGWIGQATALVRVGVR